MKIGDTVQTLGDFWVKPINGMRYREFKSGEVGKILVIGDVAIDIAMEDRVVGIPAKYAEKFVKVISDETQE